MNENLAAESYPNRTLCRSMLLILGVCFVFYGFLGFPILLPDSRRYLGAAATFQVSFNAPTLYSFLLRPIYMLIGPWAFALANSLVASYLSVRIAAVLYKRNLNLSIVSSLALSMVLMNMATVMMDIQVTFAILALLLIAADPDDITSQLLFGFCLISHNSAMLIATLMSIALFICIRDKKFIKNSALVLAFSFLAISFYNYRMENRFSPLPRHSSQFLVARLIVDIPESMDGYVLAHPSSCFTSFWGPFEEKYRKALHDHDDAVLEQPLLYQPDGLTKAGKDNIAKEATSFIRYAIINYPKQYVFATTRNFLMFFSHALDPKYVGIFFTSWNGYDFHDYQHQYFPWMDSSPRFGAQYQERLHIFFSAPISLGLFDIAILFNIIIIASHVLKKKVPHGIYVFSLVNILFTIINGFVASNFGVNTADGRFFMKPFWPCILAMFMWMEHRTRARREGLHRPSGRATTG